MTPRLILAPLLFLLFAAQDAAPEPLRPNLDAICAQLTKDHAELMDDCLAQEELAFISVLGWLQQYGLLTPDGAIDTLALLQAQLDTSLNGGTPASAASFCFETSADWLSLEQCLEALASAPGFGEPDPFGLDPGLGPLLGN